MIASLKVLNKLDSTLARLTEEDTDKLYLRLFSSDDGQLVLRDLMNRCHMVCPAETEIEEGRRQVYLAIQSRLYNAVNGKKEDLDG